MLAAAIALFATLMGASDFENYEHSLASLDRGTGFETTKILGRPAFTLAFGLGVRLPLHGGLQGSPAAWLAPYLPEPVTYWLLLMLAIAAAACVARHALEPLCGRVASSIATLLLFFSLPIVNYTIADDWPETAVTYCAVIACVFAPHALLEVWTASASASRRLIARASIVGLLASLLIVSHPGYWPLLGFTLVVSAALAALRTDYPLRSRLAIVATLGVVSSGAIALVAPDIVREISVAGDALATMGRSTRPPEGGLWSANAPFLDGNARRPFMFLAMTGVSFLIGLACDDAARRRLTVGCALAAWVCGAAAAKLSSGGSWWTPSAMWALRDPAVGFAILSAGCAVGSLHANRIARAIGPATAAVLLLVGGLQGLVVAAEAVGQVRDIDDLIDRNVAPRATQGEYIRLSDRGLDAGRVTKGSRIALWPEVGPRMRNDHMSQTDFVDAGYVLVTARTKQRTMRGLVAPNDTLFEQSTYLSEQILCSRPAVEFLQLDYLFAPKRIACDVWTMTEPTLIVDERWIVHAAAARDRRVRSLPSAALTHALRHEPALSAPASLLSALAPVPGSSLALGSGDVVIRQNDPSAAHGLTFVLPLAYDSAWTASSGSVDNVGGLVAVTGADQRQIVLRFAPDAVALLRSVSAVVAQILCCLGLIGLATIVPSTARADTRIDGWAERGRRSAASALRAAVKWVRRYVSGADALYVGYAVLVIVNVDSQSADPSRISLPAALLLPAAFLIVTRLARISSMRDWLGGGLLTLAIFWVLSRGSLAVQALHDPLFWAIVAGLAFAVSLAARRRPFVASAAMAVAASTVMVAMFLPMLPNFEAALPALDPGTVRGSLAALVAQLGSVVTVALIALCVHALVRHGLQRQTWARTPLAARTAILSGVALCLAGAVPQPQLGPVWMATLGALMGLAQVDGGPRRSLHRDQLFK